MFVKESLGVLLVFIAGQVVSFFTQTNLLHGVNTDQLNYGVAVSDVDGDGNLEFIVCGFDGSNLVLKYDQNSNRLQNIAQEGTPFAALRDPQGRTIGVAACDIDGDGREEIYFLNTNNAYAGRASYSDKLFKWRDGRYVDLYSDDANRELAGQTFAGRSVACVDRTGSGKYSFALATYSMGGNGKFSLIEMDMLHPENNVRSGRIVLKDIAEEVGIARMTGGRGITVGPIVGRNGSSDLFFVNEGNYRLGNKGDNFLFLNSGDGKGTFMDIASKVGVADPNENGRGVALGDFNRDGLVDIVYGNWVGEHRLFLQKQDKSRSMTFTDVATNDMKKPSLIRTVIVADFDNSGTTDIFYNNICGGPAYQTENRLFTISSDSSSSMSIHKVNIGDALEPDGCGTGAAVADIDHDGVLDLVISHGESQGQPLSTYKASLSSNANWIRVFPKTKFGAPARGAAVSLKFKDGRTDMRIIDGGSGYLCQMEPIAHFGLGATSDVESLKVRWPDGNTYDHRIEGTDINTVLEIDWFQSSKSYDKVDGTFFAKVVELLMDFVPMTNSSVFSNQKLNILSTAVAVIMTFCIYRLMYRIF